MKIAILGSHGLVSEELQSILIQDDYVFDVYSYFHHHDVKKCYDYDYLFLCTKEKIEEEDFQYLLQHNRHLILFPDGYRDTYPLKVPGVTDLSGYEGKVICNPNCICIGVSLLLHELVNEMPKEIFLLTLQGLSGAGRLYVKEWNEGLHKNITSPIPNEENKIKKELSKILDIPMICVYTQRVPIERGHHFFLEIPKQSSLSTCNSNRTVPIDFLSEHSFYIKNPHVFYRILESKDENTLKLWGTFDNLYVGASYNAFLIMKEWVKYDQSVENRGIMF